MPSIPNNNINSFDSSDESSSSDDENEKDQNPQLSNSPSKLCSLTHVQVDVPKATGGQEFRRP